MEDTPQYTPATSRSLGTAPLCSRSASAPTSQELHRETEREEGERKRLCEVKTEGLADGGGYVGAATLGVAEREVEMEGARGELGKGKCKREVLRRVDKERDTRALRGERERQIRG